MQFIAHCIAFRRLSSNALIMLQDSEAVQLNASDCISLFVFRYGEQQLQIVHMLFFECTGKQDFSTEATMNLAYSQ